MRTCFESAEIKFFQKAERRATPASVASISNHFPRVASINDNARWVVCPVPAVSWETTLQTVTDADTMQTVYRTVVIRVSLCVCVHCPLSVRPAGFIAIVECQWMNDGDARRNSF